nr:hypothetical protein [Tanacetum cinerariifolium]
MKDKCQMSSMRELTFFLGLQVKQKKDGIFISQDKYVAKILRKFGLSEEKSASTPIDAEKPLLKDSDGEDVDDSPFDLEAYSDSDYAGASLDRKSTTEGCQFLGCRLVSWQCKKQIVVATSSTEAEYVVAASGCAQRKYTYVNHQGLRILKILTKYTKWSRHFIDYIKLIELALCQSFEKLMKDKFQMSSMGELTFFLGKLASTPIDADKPLLKDSDGEDVDVHTYRSMIYSLMYLTSSRPDIMFADSPFDLVAYSDSDCAGASLDRKSTTGGCQIFGCRLISWQCKKQTMVSTFSTEAEYVAAASGCAQVLWIQNQLLDYGYNFMHTSWLVQKQTALGKDSSNPLIVDSLLKTIWFSIHHHLTIEVLAIPGQTTTGVNTPRSDEDRLKLIELMVFLLQKGKSDAAEGFKQIIDFLNGSYIHYALTVNPHIYVSCIKQFWNTASVKCSDDVTRLQALVDRKKIVISEDVICEILQLDDVEGVSLSAKRTSWNEFSTAMASAVICLSTGQKFNFSKYIFDSLVHNVDSSLKFYMYPRFIQLIIQNQIGDLSTHTTSYISPALTQKVFANMRRVRKGFSGVEIPLFKGMIVARAIAEEEIVEEQVQADDAVAAAVHETVAEDVAKDVANEAIPSTPTTLILPSPPSHDIPSTTQVGTSQRVVSSDDMEDVFNQERMIDDLDKDEGIELVVDQVKDADSAKTKGRHAAEQAKKQ